MIVKKAGDRSNADLEMQHDTLGKVKTTSSQQLRTFLPQAAHETKSGGIESQCIVNNGPLSMPKSPKNDSTESSSSASTPTNDPLKGSLTDAEIWSQVRNHSLPQLQAHKSLLQQELKVLKKSLSSTQSAANIEEIQSLQQRVKRNWEIVKNAIFLLELGKEKAPTPQPSHHSTRHQPSLAELFKDEKKRLTKELKSFEEQFAVTHGQPISNAADIEPKVAQYHRLQKLLGAIAALSLEHDYQLHETDKRQEICVQ
jgi:inorganic triphosphatase YgiF